MTNFSFVMQQHTVQPYCFRVWLYYVKATLCNNSTSQEQLPVHFYKTYKSTTQNNKKRPVCNILACYWYLNLMFDYKL